MNEVQTQSIVRSSQFYNGIRKAVMSKTVKTQLLEVCKLALPYVRDCEHRGSTHDVYSNAWFLVRIMTSVLENAGLTEKEACDLWELPYDDKWHDDNSKIHNLILNKK